MQYLMAHFPCLCIHVMKKNGMKRELEKYMEDCKAKEDGEIGQYSLYVHGYWLPWLEMEREAGNLVQGRL